VCARTPAVRSAARDGGQGARSALFVEAFSRVASRLLIGTVDEGTGALPHPASRRWRLKALAPRAVGRPARLARDVFPAATKVPSEPGPQPVEPAMPAPPGPRPATREHRASRLRAHPAAVRRGVLLKRRRLLPPHGRARPSPAAARPPPSCSSGFGRTALNPPAPHRALPARRGNAVSRTRGVQVNRPRPSRIRRPGSASRRRSPGACAAGMVTRRTWPIGSRAPWAMATCGRG